ncbi:MAG: hypothetical protein SGARI_002613 [Bacillariaceae sp.]
MLQDLQGHLPTILLGHTGMNSAARQLKGSHDNDTEKMMAKEFLSGRKLLTKVTKGMGEHPNDTEREMLMQAAERYFAVYNLAKNDAAVVNPKERSTVLHEDLLRIDTIFTAEYNALKTSDISRFDASLGAPEDSMKRKEGIKPSPDRNRFCANQLTLLQKHLKSCTTADGEIIFLSEKAISFFKESEQYLAEELELIEGLSRGRKEFVDAMVSSAMKAKQEKKISDQHEDISTDSASREGAEIAECTLNNDAEAPKVQPKVTAWRKVCQLPSRNVATMVCIGAVVAVGAILYFPYRKEKA